MILEFLRHLNQGVLLVALVPLWAIGASLIWLVAQHLRLRRSALAKEAMLLARALPPDRELPHVLVQVPTFNEGSVIARIAQAVGALDWPRDKLHIQVLDDSNDGSTELAKQAIAVLQARGIDAAVLHRANRSGFKAAALQAGLQLSGHEYIAVFDADFVPAPEFLRQCMRVLLAEPELGFVQARWDFFNGSDNALTGAQQRLLDAYFAVEQPARAWSGHLVLFNGSCGVWRRAAVDALGGWVSDILPEDIDISFRALLQGVRGACLVTVAAPGELPESGAVWRTQQFRWNNGFAQAMRKYLPAIWRSQLSLPRKLTASLYLGFFTFGPLLTVIAAGAAIELAFGRDASAILLGLTAFVLIQFAVGGVLMVLLGQRLLRNADRWTELPRTVGTIGIFVCAQLIAMKGLLDAFRGKASIWIPTPKKGASLMSGTGTVPHTRGLEG